MKRMGLDCELELLEQRRRGTAIRESRNDVWHERQCVRNGNLTTCLRPASPGYPKRVTPRIVWSVTGCIQKERLAVDPGDYGEHPNRHLPDRAIRGVTPFPRPCS